MISRLRIAPIGPDTVDDALRIRVQPDQERFVAPVERSLAEAYAFRAVAWPRLVYDGDRAVAFVMGSMDPDNELDFFRYGIWRLNVAADEQGKGYGRAAVRAVLDEVRKHGQRRATVLWVPGDDGPEGFYLRLGFRPTGQEFHGQVVGEILLD